MSTAGGDLLLALSKKKAPDIRYETVDPARQARLNQRWGVYDTAFDPSANKDYLAAHAANQPGAQKIAGANVDWLSRYATGAYDPTKSYTDILGANQAALGSFLINPARNELERKRKSRLASAGYGNQGATGAYADLLDADTLQLLASQAVPNLLGYSTQAYGTAAGLENQNFLNRMGIIGSGEQYRQLDTPAMRYLEPSRIARSDLAASMPAFRGLASEEDMNRAYWRKPSGLELAGDSLNAFQGGLVNEANDYLDLYTRAYSGGLVGGGGGAGGIAGMGGGKTGSSGTPGYSPYQPYYGDPTTTAPYSWK